MIRLSGDFLTNALRQKSVTSAVGLMLALLWPASNSAIHAAIEELPKPGSEVVLRGPEVNLKRGNTNISVGRDCLRYRVRQISDSWIYLVSVRSSGWVKPSDIVPIEKAEDFYTEILENEPAITWPRLWRSSERTLRGEFDAALADLDEVLRRDPTDAAALIQRGLVLRSKGDYDAALADYDKAAAFAPADPRVYAGRALARQAKNQPDQANADLSEAIRLDPGNGELYLIRGILNREQEKLDEALGDLNTAIALNPMSAEAFYQRGSVRIEKGQLDWALADSNEAVALNPSFALAHRQLGNVRFLLLDFSGAADSYETAVRIAPDDFETLNQLAWFRATCPEAKIRDGRKAVEMARKADELSGGENADVLDTLAAAYAEDGRFEEAVSTQAKALEHFEKDDPDRVEAEKRAELYKAKKTFRADP